MSTPHRPSRRAVVGAAAWSAPAIVVAGAVPAFASSTESGGISAAPTAYHHYPAAGRPQGLAGNEGSVSNSTTSPVLVTATVIVVCDTEGDGAGTTTGANYDGGPRWNFVDSTFVVVDNEPRGFSATFAQTLVGGTSDALPLVSILVGNHVTGTVTVQLSADSVTVTQPTAVRWGVAGSSRGARTAPTSSARARRFP